MLKRAAWLARARISRESTNHCDNQFCELCLATNSKTKFTIISRICKESLISLNKTFNEFNHVSIEYAKKRNSYLKISRANDDEQSHNDPWARNGTFHIQICDSD